jgi:hypothetical protein
MNDLFACHGNHGPQIRVDIGSLASHARNWTAAMALPSRADASA